MGTAFAFLSTLQAARKICISLFALACVGSIAGIVIHASAQARARDGLVLEYGYADAFAADKSSELASAASIGSRKSLTDKQGIRLVIRDHDGWRTIANDSKGIDSHLAVLVDPRNPLRIRWIGFVMMALAVGGALVVTPALAGAGLRYVALIAVAAIAAMGGSCLLCEPFGRIEPLFPILGALLYLPIIVASFAPKPASWIEVSAKIGLAAMMGGVLVAQFAIPKACPLCALFIFCNALILVGLEVTANSPTVSVLMVPGFGFRAGMTVACVVLVSKLILAGGLVAAPGPLQQLSALKLVGSQLSDHCRNLDQPSMFSGVVLVGLSSCPACVQAKADLLRHGVPYLDLEPCRNGELRPCAGETSEAFVEPTILVVEGGRIYDVQEGWPASSEAVDLMLEGLLSRSRK